MSWRSAIPKTKRSDLERSVCSLCRYKIAKRQDIGKQQLLKLRHETHRPEETYLSAHQTLGPSDATIPHEDAKLPQMPKSLRCQILRCQTPSDPQTLRCHAILAAHAKDDKIQPEYEQCATKKERIKQTNTQNKGKQRKYAVSMYGWHSPLAELRRSRRCPPPCCLRCPSSRRAWTAMSVNKLQMDTQARKVEYIPGSH